MSLAIRPGRNQTSIIRELTDLTTDGNNVITAYHEGEALRSHYLQWVESLEAHLRSMFTDSAISQHALTDRYFTILEEGRNLARMRPLIQAEVMAQLDWLAELMEPITALDRALGETSSIIAVVDTNLFLHYPPFPQIPWPEITDTDSICLAIPLRVIEELDELKYRGQPKVRQRARHALRLIRESLIPTKGLVATINPNTTLQVLTQAKNRVRTSDADEEILQAAFDLLAFQRRVVLITGDNAMLIRGLSLGIEVVFMPEELDLENKSDAGGLPEAAT
ncbi:MAG: PIN domain-containing protein [Hyphomicrobiales bacterium]